MSVAGNIHSYFGLTSLKRGTQLRRILGARSSLQVKLAIRLTAVLAGTLLIGNLGMAWRAVSTINSLDDRALQFQAEDIARHLSVGPDGRPHLALPVQLWAAYQHSGQAYLFMVSDAQGRSLFESDPGTKAGRLLASRMPPGGEERFFDLEGQGIGQFLAYSRPYGAFRVAVAQERIDRDALSDAIMDDFVEFTALVVVPIVLLTLLAAVLTIRGSLGPVRRVSARAAEITPQTTSIRLSSRALPTEIRPLVQAFNRALDRLAEGFDLQRRFTADAAHELRTPLAVLLAHVDLLEDKQTAKELRADVRAMSRVVDQLLSVARLESGELNFSAPVDLKEMAAEVVRRLAPLIIGQGLQIALRAPSEPVEILGNADAILTALANLVENAAVHSPSGGEIEVAVEPEGVLMVSDRGPGIPSEERTGIFRRFERGRKPKGVGAGLGLAIVAETMAAHGGSVEVTDREGGGASFVLRFPPRAPLRPDIRVHADTSRPAGKTALQSGPASDPLIRSGET